MKMKPTRLGFNAIIALLMIPLFLSCAVLSVWAVTRMAHQVAMQHAEEIAAVILDRNLATHRYFNEQLKPSVFEAFATVTAESPPFDHRWMSSTYAIREIDGIFQSSGKHPGYYYKECAINARSPFNEADPFESDMLRKMEADPSIKSWEGVREVAGKPFFVYLARGESMEEGCLRCHSTPENAPAGLIDYYGPERSFHRFKGQLVSAVSIRVPMETIFASIRNMALILAISMLAILAGMIFIQGFILRRWLIRPLKRLHQRAMLIAEEPRKAMEQLPLEGAREFVELARAVNRMNESLGRYHADLEENVAARTAELQRALEDIKTLKGIVPICCSCKKIRDDKGYWTQVEAYVTEHTEAEFSHGICPDCEKKLYPQISVFDSPDAR